MVFGYAPCQQLPSERFSGYLGGVATRARKIEKFLSQPFFVAEIFTGMSGKYVKLEDTIKGFNMILAGELDHLPEQAFYLVGSIDEVKAKAEKIASEAKA